MDEVFAYPDYWRRAVGHRAGFYYPAPAHPPSLVSFDSLVLRATVRFLLNITVLNLERWYSRRMTNGTTRPEEFAIDPNGLDLLASPERKLPATSNKTTTPVESS